MEDGRWAVTADYLSGEAPRQALFLYDVRGRFSVAGNDDARWILGEQSPGRGPQPGRRRPAPVSRPTTPSRPSTSATSWRSSEPSRSRRWLPAPVTAPARPRSRRWDTIAGRSGHRRRRARRSRPDPTAGRADEPEADEPAAVEDSELDVLTDIFAEQDRRTRSRARDDTLYEETLLGVGLPTGLRGRQRAGATRPRCPSHPTPRRGLGAGHRGRLPGRAQRGPVRRRREVPRATTTPVARSRRGRTTVATRRRWRIRSCSAHAEELEPESRAELTAAGADEPAEQLLPLDVPEPDSGDPTQVPKAQARVGPELRRDHVRWSEGVTPLTHGGVLRASPVAAGDRGR